MIMKRKLSNKGKKFNQYQQQQKTISDPLT